MVRAKNQDFKDYLKERLFAKYGVSYAKGEVIFKQGDPSDAVYIIYEGEIILYVSEGNHQREVARVGKGEVLGEMGVIDKRPRGATAIAANDVKLIRLSPSTFNAMVRYNASFSLHMLSMISERLRTRNKLYGQLHERYNSCISLHIAIKIINALSSSALTKNKIFSMFSENNLTEVEKVLDKLISKNIIFEDQEIYFLNSFDGISELFLALADFIVEI